MHDLPLLREEGGTYLPLAAFRALPRNTRIHDDPGIGKAMARFGMIDTPTVNLRTGHTLAGWGRVTALRVMQRAGDARPAGVRAHEGDWAVPVYTAGVPEADEEAAALALNKLVETGGYNEMLLLEVLQDLEAGEAGRLDAAGYHPDEVAYLAQALRQAPPDPAPKERPPETHKRFAVGKYHWEVANEAYARWRAELEAEVLARHEAEGGAAGEETPPDLQPGLRALLKARLGFEEEGDGGDLPEGD